MMGYPVVPEHLCLTGQCDCESAKQCKFKRCAKCDNPLDPTGKAFDDGRWYPEHQRCPDCGGGVRP
jgi:hypothetical protein